MRGDRSAGRWANPLESSRILRVYVYLIAIVLILPLVVVVGMAVSEGRYLVFPPREFSFEALSRVLASDEWMRSFRQSLLVAVLASVASTALGTAAALGLGNSRYRRAIQALIIMPMVVPTVVTALAIFPVFSWFGLIGSTSGLVLAHTIVTLPFAYLTVWASVSALDPSFERAAMSMGASWWQMRRRITLPLILPALVASMIVSSAVSFDEVVISLFVASPSSQTVPVILWWNLRDNLGPDVAAAALLVVIINVCILVVGALIARRLVVQRVKGV